MSGVDSRGRTTNRAGIDLTPGAARALGIDGKGTVSWEFANMPASGQVSDQGPVPTGDSTLGDLAKWLGQLVTTVGTINGAVVPSNQPAQQNPIFGGIGNMPTPAPANLDPVLQQVLAILQAVGPQITQPQTPGGPASPQDVLVRMIGILNAANGITSTPGGVAPTLPLGGVPTLSLGSVPTLPLGGVPTLPLGGVPTLPLGPVNGALGQTIGNLLNDSKSAIGILGALAVQLGQAPGLAGLVPSALGTAIAPYATPIFLALTAWGFLGKMEKFAQATTAAAQSTTQK